MGARSNARSAVKKIKPTVTVITVMDYLMMRGLLRTTLTRLKKRLKARARKRSSISAVCGSMNVR